MPQPCFTDNNCAEFEKIAHFAARFMNEKLRALVAAIYRLK
jgi:hypothetical protein